MLAYVITNKINGKHSVGLHEKRDHVFRKI